jgi:hypothetical protein
MSVAPPTLAHLWQLKCLQIAIIGIFLPKRFNYKMVTPQKAILSPREHVQNTHTHTHTHTHTQRERERERERERKQNQNLALNAKTVKVEELATKEQDW